MKNSDNPFVLAQLEEALEERQTPDRRKTKKGENSEIKVEKERRQGSRRTSSKP